MQRMARTEEHPMTDLVEKIRDAAEELPTVYTEYQRDQGRLDQAEKMLDLAADKIEYLEELFLSVAIDPDLTNAEFSKGDWVEKHTGDYKAVGQVRQAFTITDGGPIRYVVRHKAEGGGNFCHIYSAKNLRKTEKPE